MTALYHKKKEHSLLTFAEDGGLLTKANIPSHKGDRPMIVVALAGIAALLTRIFRRGRSARPAEADQGGPLSAEGPGPTVEIAMVPPISGGRSE
jgi:hypothetical protein